MSQQKEGLLKDDDDDASAFSSSSNSLDAPPPLSSNKYNNNNNNTDRSHDDAVGDLSSCHGGGGGSAGEHHLDHYYHHQLHHSNGSGDNGGTRQTHNSSSSPNNNNNNSSSTSHGLQLYRGALRIELPYSGSPPCTSPASPAEVTSNTTTNQSPRTAIYRGPENAAFPREREECTPLLLAEQHARQSAMALLHADISNRSHTANRHAAAAAQQQQALLSGSSSQSQQQQQQQQQQASVLFQANASMSPAVSGSFEMTDLAMTTSNAAASPPPPPQKKRVPLPQFFTRKNRSTLSSSSAALHGGPADFHAREISTALDLTSGADQDSHQHTPALRSTSTPRQESGSSELPMAGGPSPQLHSSRLATSLTSMERLANSASASSPPPPALMSGGGGGGLGGGFTHAVPVPLQDARKRGKEGKDGKKQKTKKKHVGHVLSSDSSSPNNSDNLNNLETNNKDRSNRRQNNSHHHHPNSNGMNGGGLPTPPSEEDAINVEDDEEGIDSSESSAQNIGMEAVLRDASKVRGIRLSWLLYLLIVMVIVLFTLLLVQIIYESNRTLVRTATQAVRAQASVLSNSIDVQNYALINIFFLMHDMSLDSFNSSNPTYTIVRENFCSRFYGAPMAFALYNETGAMVWKMRCVLYPTSKGYQKLPRRVMPGSDEVRLADFAWDAALAQQSFYSTTNSSVETFVMLMDKDTLGRTLLVNSYPQYSSSTLQYVTSAYFTRMYNDSQPKLLFHTLTNTRTTYTSTESGSVHDSLTTLFEKICYQGSPYIWHTVAHYPDADSSSSASSSFSGSDGNDIPPPYSRWPLTTTNEIPTPHLEYGRAWRQLSVANICGLQCFGEAGDTACAADNPTNVWYVVEYSLMKQNGLSSILNVVGGVSIVALVIFSFVMFLVYISITVPVNFLRVQLLKAVGATDTQTNFQRKIVGWTYRLWLGDLTAIVRSTHILSLCFQLNKKYVPDHVLRNHAQQLFLRRRKFNFLEDVDLKDDPADRGDTESESDLDPAMPTLQGVSAVLPSSESRFLWRFAAAANENEDGNLMNNNNNSSGVGVGGNGGGSGSSSAAVSAALHARHSTDMDAFVQSNDGGGHDGVAGAASSLTAAPMGGSGLSGGGGVGSNGKLMLLNAGEVPPLAPPRATAGLNSTVNNYNNNSTAVDASSVFAKRSRSMKRVSTLGNDSAAVAPWPMGEVDNSPYAFGEQDASLAMSAMHYNYTGATNTYNKNNNSFNTMMIRRESESTILCVRIPSVELAYMLNYSAAVVQHRRIMRILLHRIRRHKGALFHRSGDCLAAVWNAFEGCPNHAEAAAICAQEIANAFAPFRVDGLHIGLVLHQGVLVCGTVEYSKAAFVTAFGDGPREAVALADLAAAVGTLNVLVTEPVKQSLSGLYDCNIVDVIQLPSSAHPLLLFELGSSRSRYPTPSPPLRAQFAIEYARVFAQFRNHEFNEALHGIEHIRLSLSSAQNEHLLRRLERLCFYYATTPSALPFPYNRPLPTWVNYEAIAQAGLQNNTRLYPLRNNSLLSRSFLDGVVYQGVPTVLDEVNYIKDFKQELQENMRRTARKGNGSPTMDETSTRPHITPQTSPPMRPTADPTVLSERVMSVGSGMELMVDVSSNASPRSRHVDPNTNNNNNSDNNNNNDWRTTSARTSTMDLPAPLLPPALNAQSAGVHATGTNNNNTNRCSNNNSSSTSGFAAGGSISGAGAGMEGRTRITAVPSLSTMPSVPLLTFEALQISSTEPSTAVGAGAPTPDGAAAQRAGRGVDDYGCEESPVSAAAAAAAAALRDASVAAAVTAASAEHPSLIGSSIQTMDSPRDVFALSSRFAMTHSVTNRPPVALAAASPELPALTAERRVAETLTHNSDEHNNDNTSNSIILSAGMSFKNSVNNMLNGNGGQGMLQGFSVSPSALPTEIKAKSGTTYLRSTRILGKGSFGCVYLGMDAHSGRLVAIKFLPMPSDESGMEDIEAEVLILQRVNDTHVVQLLSYAFEGDTIVIIMECMLAGSLQNMISAFGSIPSSTARVFMRDVLRGLSKIHSMGVIHRDMKPQNVLLSLAGNCKISDFGASAWLQELARKESQGQVCGTPVYLAPEAARGNPAKESDIWSCGIMFLQMITGALPYPPQQLSAGAAVLVFQIGSGIAQPQIPDDLDELNAEFVRACLQVEPSKRLTASALLQLPLFTV